MAFTERYVTQAASGGGDGSSGSPWTLAEAFSSAAAGDRVNIQSDAGYSSGALTVSSAGTLTQLVVFRGYNSTIGDLDSQGRETEGELDTTNFPVITLTGAITPSQYMVFQNLNISGLIASTGLVYTTGTDNITLISCKLVNSGSGRVMRLDNYAQLISCDFECSASSHDAVVDIDGRANLIDCRFKATEASGVCLLIEDGYIDSCVFIANSTSIGVKFNPQFGAGRVIKNCTMYGLLKAIELPDSASIGSTPILINNHITDCETKIDNLYSATSTWAIIEINDRTRDNTTGNSGIGDGVEFGEVTTDTGGPSTDYTDAANGDLSLISGAPGIDAGLGVGDWDIGAYQNAEGGGGGGGDTYSPLIIAPNGNRIGVKEV